jgi:hypothetical protein
MLKNLLDVNCVQEENNFRIVTKPRTDPAFIILLVSVSLALKINSYKLQLRSFHNIFKVHIIGFQHFMCRRDAFVKAEKKLAMIHRVIEYEEIQEIRRNHHTREELCRRKT